MAETYPHMISLSSGDTLPGLDLRQTREARRIGEKILRRTGRYTRYNADTGGLFVHVKAGDIDSGVIELSFDRWTRLTDSQLDDACRWLQRGAMPKKLKDRLKLSEQLAAESNRAEQLGRRCEEAHHGVAATLKRVRNRRGMGKHFRPSAVVSGLKPGA